MQQVDVTLSELIILLKEYEDAGQGHRIVAMGISLGFGNRVWGKVDTLAEAPDTIILLGVKHE